MGNKGNTSKRQIPFVFYFEMLPVVDNAHIHIVWNIFNILYCFLTSHVWLSQLEAGKSLEPNLIAFSAAISACDKGSLWQWLAWISQEWLSRILLATAILGLRPLNLNEIRKTHENTVKALHAMNHCEQLSVGITLRQALQHLSESGLGGAHFSFIMLKVWKFVSWSWSLAHWPHVGQPRNWLCATLTLTP